MNDGAVTGIPEVDDMTPSEAFHAGRKSAAAEIKRLRSLLVRYQAANYIPEDCDLYAETRAVLEQLAREREETETSKALDVVERDFQK